MTTSVIKEEDIKKGGAYNVRDALKPLTRLNVMEAGMTGNQVSIRGMGTSSTLILIVTADALPERIREVP